jgi:hypothetical protein
MWNVACLVVLFGALYMVAQVLHSTDWQMIAAGLFGYFVCYFTNGCAKRDGFEERADGRY